MIRGYKIPVFQEKGLFIFHFKFNCAESLLSDQILFRGKIWLLNLCLGVFFPHNRLINGEASLG